MGRNLKKGLDYFSHDVDYDTKLEVVISICGEKGHGIINRIWQHIYKNEGYYMEHNEDEIFIIQRKCSDATTTEIENLITEMVKRDLFCKHKHDEYNILTSKRLQRNYWEVKKRRKDADISVDINSDFELIYVDINQQRKGKGIKEEEIKGNNSKLDERKKATADLISEEFKRLLTPAETQDITILFNDLNPTDNEIREALLISIQRKVHSIVYIRGIIEKERGGFKPLPKPNLEDALGNK